MRPQGLPHVTLFIAGAHRNARLGAECTRSATETRVSAPAAGRVSGAACRRSRPR